MNSYAKMPYVILFGILVFFVVLRLARGGFGGGLMKSPIVRMFVIVWLVIILGSLLIFLLKHAG